MGLRIFERVWQKKPLSEEQAERPIPRYGRERIAFVISGHWMELLGMNLLFLLCCLPVITIPSAIAGMTRIVMLWTRDAAKVDFRKEYWSGFRRRFAERLLLWLVIALPPVSAAAMLTMAGASGKATVVFFLLGAVSFLVQCYWFPVTEIIGISLTSALKNAFLLIAADWRTSLKLLFSIGLIYAVSIVFYLYAVPLALIGLFSFSSCFICAWVNQTIEQKHLIRLDGDQPSGDLPR